MGNERDASEDETAPGARAKRKPSAKRPKKKTTKQSDVKPASARASRKRPSAKKAKKKRPSAKKATAKTSAKKATAKTSAKKASARKASTKSTVQVSPKTTANKTTRSSSGPPRRPPADGGAVLITGMCGRLGRLLTRVLHRTDRVVGIDRRPFPDIPKDVVHHQFDARRKKTRDLFRNGDIRAVVHLGVLHDPRKSDRERHTWNVVGFQKLLGYLAQYRVPKLVVLSSANVYGPQPTNPQFLTEEAPLSGSQDFRGIRDLVELDMLAQSFFWRHPDTETVILRPCHILGRVKNAASNYLRLERPITLMGFDPMVQPIHERDVVHAIQLALQPGARGIFNLRGPGELPLSKVMRVLSRRTRPMPAPLAKGVLDRLWRFRMTSFPAEEIDHI